MLTMLPSLLLLSALAGQAKPVAAVPQQQHQLKLFAARIEPLPGRKNKKTYNNVTGTILVASTVPNPQVEGDNGMWTMFMGGSLTGLEPNVDANNETQCSSSSCQVDLYWGTSCEDIQWLAYQCGGKRDADGNPWKRAKYSTDENGNGLLQHFSVLPNYAQRWDGGEPDNFVLVVRSAYDDKKVACGNVHRLEDGSFANNHTDVEIKTSILYNQEEESNEPLMDTSGLHESVVAEWFAQHKPTVDGTTVMALDAHVQAEDNTSTRCYLGYTKGPFRQPASTFLTTTTHHRCSVYNHTGNGNKAKTKTAVMDGWGRKTNATTFLFANNYAISDGDGGGGKAWFGGCTTKGIDLEQNRTELSTAMAKTASSTRSGMEQEDIVAMIDSLQENLACGVQQEYVPPSTPSPTLAPSFYTPPILPVTKNAEEEEQALSSSALRTSAFSTTSTAVALLVTAAMLPLQYF